MKIYFKEISLSTRESSELVDITQEVSNFVKESNVDSGICMVDTPHSTSAIITNENEIGLKEDIVRKIEEEFPKNAKWQHDRIDDNAHAHLAAVFLGHSKTFPIKDGNLVRGMWQNIFFVELDGPRTRRILFEILGE